MVLKFFGTIFLIILAILAIFGVAAVVFVSICLLDDKKREQEQFDNTSSEE